MAEHHPLKKEQRQSLKKKKFFFIPGSLDYELKRCTAPQFQARLFLYIVLEY